ncbi:MAG: hypothetical protein LBD33_01745 [Puniceicoccales bacterium]|jgi:hypothetical protein|nr:hypothetical protein [Puniceicoccales bacterium]
MSVNFGTSVGGTASSPGSDDCSKSGFIKQVVTPILHNLLRPARVWFANRRHYIYKWLAIGLGIGVAACAASFGLGYLLSYYGVTGALSAVGAIGTRSIGALIWAILSGPIKAGGRWISQTQFNPHLGEWASLFLVNVTATVALLPVGGLPSGLGFLSTILSGAQLIFPAAAMFLPSFLQRIGLGGRRWLFVVVVCMLLKSVITVCCFGAVRAGVFLFVNIPSFIMLFVLYYLDKQSGSFIPSICTSIGVSLASLVVSFIL